MFLIMVKHSNFHEYFPEKIPNQILTENEFAILFSAELDKYAFNHHNN